MPPTTTILITGPTASGKSSLALGLAERLGAVVINADAMQVYRELRILTARPTEGAEARAPHRLYGHVPAAEAYSVGRFVRDAAGEIAHAHGAGRIAVVVGGTGLYLKALTEGLSPVPAVPAEVRAFWRRQAEVLGPGALHGELLRRDPAMARRLRPTDPQRLTRALEVIDGTGRSLAAWQAEPGRPVVAQAATARIVLALPRDELARRCEARFDDMMAEGAVAEAAALAALDLDQGLPAMRALGVRPLIELSKGRIAQTEAVARAKAETRQFAKRQMTWLRGHMMSWRWLSEQEMESQMDESMTFIRS